MHPKLLLITDTQLGDSSSGISRTLANLLDRYPVEKLLILTSQESAEKEKPGFRYKDRMCFYKEFPLGPLSKRLPAINRFFLENFNNSSSSKINEFNPDIILVSTNSLECLIVADKLTENSNKPLVMYPMDDWRDHDSKKWLGGDAGAVITRLFNKSSGWMSVSQTLLDSISERYNVPLPNSLVVHNPAAAVGEVSSSSDQTLKLVYAGSVWPMHAGAILVVAKAVEELRQAGEKIELLIHTSEDFWNQTPGLHDKAGVCFGGFAAYKELQDALSKCDVGLVASSFAKEHEHLSIGSVQTKLTDYMAAGLAVLACGPEFSACNKFTEKWKCGVCIIEEDVESAKKTLLSLLNDKGLVERSAKAGWEAVKNHFSKEMVQESFYQFIKESAQDA